MERNFNPSSRDIIIEYITTHLKQRGHNWQPPEQEHQSNGTQEDYQNALSKISQSLNEISNELQEFIHKAYNDRFRESMKVLEHTNFDCESIDTLADELFNPDITWLHIVTFLYYGAELACRAIEISQEDDNDDGFDMVSKIITWMCNYTDKNLSQWIANQEGGWKSINIHKGSRNKGVKHYFGIAAFAAFVGGLYLCSKFTVQS